ncbi:MAG: SDR family NAD(P)-dependent oxidoreductase [Alphaproteobacteria bacterium]|nr:SDR family NAD(P)-dependent oxidoreductase [Alphaproteobacteria bacterium]
MNDHVKRGDRVAGKVAVVTGAGSIGPGWGNGKAAAVLYGREGARVFAVDNRAEAAKETCAIIEREGGTCTAHVADVTDKDAVALMTAACISAFGRIDILHNNVGGQGPGRRLEDITLEDWYATMDRNATSVLLTCQQVAPIMADQGNGSIVNISSVAAIRHLNVPMTTYSAAKGALNELTKNIALQYAPFQVRANCVLPGYIDTPFIQRDVGGRKSYEIKGYTSAEEYRAARDSIVPLGRMGTGWDVANAALFLASDDASYITGQCLVVDGGVTATCPGA